MNFILVISLLITGSYADFCNYHATLVETETFYLTQPFSKNISFDFSNYVDAFTKLGPLISQFKTNLALYEQSDTIEKQEPKVLYPLSDEYNLYRISETTFGRDAFNACLANGGSLVEVNNKNRQAIANLMKRISMRMTPFKALPMHSVLSYPDMEPLDTPKITTAYHILTKSPPFLTAENKIIYPDEKIELTDITTPSPTPKTYTETATSDHYKSNVLCQKENNPWDLPENRENWILVLPKIQNAIAHLKKFKESYDHSAKTLKNLPRSIWKSTTNFFKLILPDPLKTVIDFLDRFSKQKNWEKVKGTSTDRFYNFVKTALRLVRQYESQPKSLIKLQESKPEFTPTAINELNWQDLYGLDEETYGLVGPVTITPISTHVENENDIANSPVYMKGIINARIYNRNTDKITLYSVKPNVVNAETTFVKTIIQTSKLSIAYPEEISPLHCVTPSADSIKVCHKLPIQVYSSPSFDPVKCANALFAQNFSTNFQSCPRTSSRTGPIIYRAECEGTSTLVISSEKPVKLNFLCDSVQTSTNEFKTFPSFVKTDCEVQVIEGSQAQLTLPQLNPDFYQNPTIGQINSLPALDTETQFTPTVIIIVSVSCSIVVLISIAILLYGVYFVCNKCRSPNIPQQPQQQIILPQFFPAVQLNEYPFFN